MTSVKSCFHAVIVFSSRFECLKGCNIRLSARKSQTYWDANEALNNASIDRNNFLKHQGRPSENQAGSCLKVTISGLKRLPGKCGKQRHVRTKLAEAWRAPVPMNFAQ